MSALYDALPHRRAIIDRRAIWDALIPLGEGDAAWPLVKAMQAALPGYADRPAFIGWGLEDFVFDRHFLYAFRAALPDAEMHVFADANHYVLEDKHEVLVPAIRRFLETHPA